MDYRIYNHEKDGKTKINLVSEMVTNAVQVRNVMFSTILMDGWYATKSLFLHIESFNKRYFAPIASNRLVDDSGGARKYVHVKDLTWATTEQYLGKLIKINGFPKEHKVKLFWVGVEDGTTEWIVSNDLSQKNIFDDVLALVRLRWKVEQFHRELKVNTGVDKCQCRKEIKQRNHIGCAILAWVFLKKYADKIGVSIYSIK